MSLLYIPQRGESIDTDKYDAEEIEEMIWAADQFAASINPHNLGAFS